MTLQDPLNDPQAFTMDVHEFTYFIFGFAALFFILWLAQRNRRQQ